MRLYKPLTKPDGRVHSTGERHTNPYYGKRGADWVKDTNASLYNAQHEHSQARLHLEHRVSQITRNVIFTVLAILGMIVGGFIIYSIALSL
ncbi:hypothetical protein D1831_05800 [Lactiplantibacillus garii]|uniref:Uncharacterized protein n=1 Tax=Lactiplantibacillus garii TaxID=2306423 RepID=A0A426D859_9LACO|nr:hypothetical protein [Lactiplantibacillus garii]RRK10814.1 hypothetical protein D1831_05800 [Lactiplantibacillus garii]